MELVVSTGGGCGCTPFPRFVRWQLSPKDVSHNMSGPKRGESLVEEEYTPASFSLCMITAAVLISPAIFVPYTT